jgi:phage shock protein A
MTASINEMLDKAEDPQAMVNQMVREMEEALVDMREHTIAVVATAKSTAKKLERACTESESLASYVETAIRADDEDAARQALRRKGVLEHTTKVLRRELSDTEALGAKMKNELRLLESKLQEARIRRDALIAKQNAAKTRRKLYDTTESFNSSVNAARGAMDTIADSSSAFQRLEDRIEKQMAEAEAREEMLRDEYSHDAEILAIDETIEAELRALKEKLGAKSELAGSSSQAQSVGAKQE